MTWLGQRALAAAAAVAAVAAGRTGQDDGADQAVVVELARVRLEEGAYRPGVDVEVELPREAWRATIGERRWLFVDLDRDRKLTAGGTDGVALEGLPFVVPFGPRLVTDLGPCRLEFGRKELRLIPVDVGLEPGLVRQLGLLTAVRIRGGLVPLDVDAAASAAARSHCEYLAENGLNGESAGLAVHDEQPGRPGYTPEGARAGREGIIGFGATLRASVLTWYATAYHGAPLLDPALRRVGIAQTRGVALLFPSGRVDPYERVVAHPPDGARDVPLEFHYAGEIPNPSPRTNQGKGCGFPVMLHLPPDQRLREVVELTLATPDGKPVAGFVSSPASPGNPKLSSNAGCAFFIPHRPLRPDTVYRVTFRQQGMDEPLVWSFTTGGD